jgi:hypothetical protein
MDQSIKLAVKEKKKPVLAKLLVAAFNGRRNPLSQDIISLQSVVYSLDILELDMA